MKDQEQKIAVGKKPEKEEKKAGHGEAELKEGKRFDNPDNRNPEMIGRESQGGVSDSLKSSGQ